MKCDLCKGGGFLDEVTAYYLPHSIDDRPVLQHETRIVCPRCDADEDYEPSETDNGTAATDLDG
jgi:hypothetical protein